MTWLHNQALMKSGRSEFVENPNTSTFADVQSNEIVTNCQNNVCTADVHNPDREEANDDGWCEVDERSSFRSNRYTITGTRYYRKWG